MPPQQPKGLLDLVDDGDGFGAHGFTGSGGYGRDVAIARPLRKAETRALMP
jgi:hypothetical protein